MNKKTPLIGMIMFVPFLYFFPHSVAQQKKPGEWVNVDEMNLKRFYTDMPKTYLLSFPGSGNTWLRYCLEYLTKHPTLEMRTQKITKINCPIGYWCDMGTDYTKSPIWKVHYIDHMKAMGAFDPQHETLIVIVRNPKEALARIYNVLSMRNKNTALEDPTAKDLFNNTLTMRYFDILKLYDAWHPEKRYMVYYEDLITDPNNTLQGLLKFLGIDDDHLEDFMAHYDMHKQRSLNLYETQEDRSLTHGNKIRHHAQLVSPQERAKLDAYIEHVFPSVWSNYLQRYDE